MFMLVTVRTVLDLPAVSHGLPELIAGAEHLDTSVRWVHVSEQLELADLLQGGELVLTTGLMIGADPEAARRQLADLERAGAAGVFVELPPGREPTREALRIAATGTRLPVAILHERVRFVEFTEAVHRLIVADQMEQLEASRRIHETFTDLALSAASPARILAAAAQMLDAAVLLEDPDGRVVELAGPGARSWAARTDDAATSVLVSVRESAWGRLLVPERADPTARHVAERAAQALALHLMAERDAHDLALLAQSAFLTEVGSWSGSEAEAEAEARAASLGLVNGGRLIPVAIRLEPHGDDPLTATRAERSLRADLQRALEDTGATALLGHLGGEGLSALLAPARGAVRGATLDRIARTLNDGAAGRRWVGVGPVAASVIEAAAGLGEAQHVADAALQLGASGPESGSDGRGWFRAADVRLPGLVAMLSGDPRMQRFVASELGPLTEPGREADLAVVRALVETGGTKQAAAERLFLSRPALYHRISKLEDELGVSLSEPASLTSLAVALLALEAPPA